MQGFQASTTRARNRPSLLQPRTEPAGGGGFPDRHEQRQPPALEDLSGSRPRPGLQLLPGDKRYNGYLITYRNEAELAVNTTSDSEKIIDKIRKMKPGGGAALYDAIYMACTRRSLIGRAARAAARAGDHRRRARQRQQEEPSEVLEIAQRNLVTIFGVSTVAFGFNSEGEANLTRLSDETGGRVVYPLRRPVQRRVRLPCPRPPTKATTR